MAIFRVNKTNNYTVMSNRHFKEKAMSLRAKGLLSLMLSLPDNWNYSIGGLSALCKENESAIKTVLNELKEFGYLRVTKEMPNNENGGRINYIYDVFEIPIQEGKKQEVEILPLEIQQVENQRQLNTNKVITNKLNINKDIEYIVDYLNKKAKTNYRYKSADTQKHIKARLNEGFTVDDFKTVIDKKVDEWNGTDMQKFLRPSTLFGSKFESYLNQPKKVVDLKKEPWRIGCEPNFDIDKIAHDTMYNDDYDI